MSILFTIALLTSQLSVLDGDTFVIGREHIRIVNIDAPEIGHARCDAELRLGHLAKRRLQVLLGSGNITIRRGDPETGRQKDRYGRTLATVSLDGRDIGEILISEELARRWSGRRMSWCG